MQDTSTVSTGSVACAMLVANVSNVALNLLSAMVGTTFTEFAACRAGAAGPEHARVLQRDEP
jgi:hypothetical protein